jgi:thioredoxin reductase (NADPH)
MVEANELTEVPLFSTLAVAELERLSRTSADIRLQAGEYAVHEGDERALYAMLDGQVDVVKLVDGVERVLGSRRRGDIFGEVPITLGTPFPSGFRANGAARVVRVGVQEYHAVAALAPALAESVGALARKRVGGLQGIAAEPAPPRAWVLGAQWDAACSELRRFLDRNQITFAWIDPAAPDAAALWGAPLPADGAGDGDGAGPVIRFADGTTATRPRLRDVADRLGLHTAPSDGVYDTVIVGAGPAGLAAAVYGASEGLRTIVIEREAPGGQAGTSSRIENYLGFPSGVSGDELAARALQQARRLGAEILVTRAIERIDSGARTVHLDGGDAIEARTIILATGVDWRQLEIDGFDALVGKGINYGAARSEAPNTHGLDVHVVGAGNSAGQAALFFANHARSVTILCRGDALERSMSQYLVDQIRSKPNIGVAFGTEIAAVHGERALEQVELRDRATGATERHVSGGLFIFIGADAQTAWLPPEIARDARGYVLTGADVAAAGVWSEARDPYLLETSVPGVFACGDVRLGPVKRVAAAVGEGSMAIAFVHQFLSGR